MCKSNRLVDEYEFPGFRPKARIKGKEDDPGARVIVLDRRQKKGRRVAYARRDTTVSMIVRPGSSAIYRAATLGSISKLRFAVFFANGAAR